MGDGKCIFYALRVFAGRQMFYSEVLNTEKEKIGRTIIDPMYVHYTLYTTVGTFSKEII